jgi:hypothetical protein
MTALYDHRKGENVMKLVRLIYLVLFRAFAGPTAVGGSSGPFQENNPNQKYN